MVQVKRADYHRKYHSTANLALSTYGRWLENRFDSRGGGNFDIRDELDGSNAVNITALRFKIATS
jgi:hypothetical protein